jgi:ribosomal protein S25
MLLQIRNYIHRQQIVTTQQLSREFHLDLSALQPMLDIWAKKGIIKKYTQNTSCQKACFKCKTPPDYYQYLS